MKRNDHNDDDSTEPVEQYGENVGEDMTSDEIREVALDMISECDGAIVITGEFVDDGEAIEGSAMRFCSDDLDEDDRQELAVSLSRSAMRTYAPDADVLQPVEVDGLDLGDLFEALAGRMSDDDDGEDGDDDATEFGGGMFQ